MKDFETDLTAETLRSLLDYAPDTGEFTWRVTRAGKAKVGALAGALQTNGYIRIRLEGRLYLAHRLAWLYVHGGWPAPLDHINRDVADNRIENLRQCTPAQNGANRGPSIRSASGCKGVSPTENGKWRARIQVNGSKVGLGTFAEKESAQRAYMAGARKYFGEFARAA